MVHGTNAGVGNGQIEGTPTAGVGGEPPASLQGNDGGEMHIHRPKPLHGAREVLGEIAIIVVGIVIALVGEQAVEALHTQHLVEQAQAAMRAEIVEDDGPQAYARLTVAPCLSHQLDRLRQAIHTRLAPDAFGKLAASYEPPHRLWDDQAWKAAQSSGVLSRMGAAEIDRWSNAYGIIQGMHEVTQPEAEAHARLELTRFRSGRWTQARTDELNDIVDDLENRNLQIARDAAQQIFNMKASGLELNQQVRKSILKEARASYGACVAEPDLRAIEALQGQLHSPEQEALVSQHLIGR